jgi:hypothetical protein
LGETDSLEAALLHKGLHQDRSLNHTSDSFKRFMAQLNAGDDVGGLGGGSGSLEGILDGSAAGGGFNPHDLLAGSSRGGGGGMDAAAAAAIAAIDSEQQHRSMLQQTGH